MFLGCSTAKYGVSLLEPKATKLAEAASGSWFESLRWERGCLWTSIFEFLMLRLILRGGRQSDQDPQRAQRYIATLDGY
jgi:hypothetical protein